MNGERCGGFHPPKCNEVVGENRFAELDDGNGFLGGRTYSITVGVYVRVFVLFWKGYSMTKK